MPATQFIFLPGEVSINVVEALQKGIEKLSNAGQHFTQLPYALRQPFVQAIRPVRYRVRLHEVPKEKAARIRRELLDAGATVYGLLKAETRYLPKIMHDNEHIEAVIYGQHGPHSALLAATSERVIYLDKKPMVELFDEVSYEVISGIEFDLHTFFATVILHTPVRNYDFKFVNVHCAEKFARHIEKQRLEREEKDQEPIGALRGGYPPPESGLINDMAGYYWLPADEKERRRFLHEPPEEV